MPCLWPCFDTFKWLVDEDASMPPWNCVNCCYQWIQQVRDHHSTLENFQTLSIFLTSPGVSDPLGVLLIVDYYCLRARQYTTVIEIARDALFEDKALELQPNFAFSMSLALFRFEQQPLHARSALRFDGDSDEWMQKAVLTFPNCLGLSMVVQPCHSTFVLVSVELMRRNELDARKIPALSMLEHGFFQRHTDLLSLQHLVKLFCERYTRGFPEFLAQFSF